MIEFFYEMSEVEIIKSLTEGIRVDSQTENIVKQVNSFEKYLSEMKITVEKRQILQRREDYTPQTICLNY